MHVFLAVSEGTLTQQNKSNIPVFTNTWKNLHISKMYFIYSYVPFDTQRLNSLLNTLNF